MSIRLGRARVTVLSTYYQLPQVNTVEGCIDLLESSHSVFDKSL